MQNKKRIEDLDVGIWEISFIKKDGSTRTLLGTRDLSIIKEVGSEHLPKGTGKPNSSVPIFDLKEKSWRSFNPGTLISMEESHEKYE